MGELLGKYAQRWQVLLGGDRFNIFGQHMTIAWLQRFITLGSLIFWWALGFWCLNAWGLGASALANGRHWAVLCFAVPLLITPLILGVQCIWAARINRSEPLLPRPSIAQWLAAWLAEIWAAIRVFMWWQPFRHNAIANYLPATPGRRGAVLVHGYFCNRALWMDWMTQLRADQRAFIAVDLEPAFGSISEYAQVIEEAVAQVSQATGLPPVLIGHSMGGLAIRAWAAQTIGKSGRMDRVHRIITLGTPHHGTALAVLSHTQNGHEMHQGSRWLLHNMSQLPDNFAQHCTNYYSHCDNIVFPASTATILGADNRHIVGHAHVQLVFSEHIQKACLGYLET